MVTSNRHDCERGFTLVELSIVLVIVGLLIFAVLKGQELIESARLKSLMTQMNSYKTATQIFKDRYGALPGDFNQAMSVLGAPQEGDGNGTIDGDGYEGEGRSYFEHLLLAELISGVTLDDPIPDSKAGNGKIQVVNVSIEGGSQGVNFFRAGSLHGNVADGPLLTGAEAGELDMTFDDGDGRTGEIQTEGGPACRNAQGVYNFTDGSVACIFFFRIE